MCRDARSGGLSVTEMRIKDPKELRGSGLMVQRIPCQLLQQTGIVGPDDRDRGTKISLHAGPSGVIILCDVRVQPFCYQQKTVGLLLNKEQPVSDIIIPQIAGTESQMI